MTRTTSLLIGLVVAIATWIVAPLLRPDIGEAWFIGTGDWHAIALHGNEIVSAGVGVLAWILALHLPRRGRVIAGIRVGAKARDTNLISGNAH